MTSAYSNSSRALAFLSETSEDAIAALKGLVGGVGSAKYLDTSENTLATISVQIDSSRDEDRIVALTRVVAMISKGRDASQFLPAVLKLTSCSNLDVRKLVYIILLRYANTNPDLTLLSINSFQRDLSDPSPLLRAMALRVLSSIKVRMVAPIVIMAVSKASRDPNPYVRKIAALAIPKCFQIDASQLPTLLESLSTLLADKSPFVLGSALSAFQQVCPDKWDLLHRDYRKICHALADMDEWSQITALQVLSRYARTNFLRPSGKSVHNQDLDPKAPPPFVNSSSTSAGVSEPRKDSDGLEAFLSTETATLAENTTSVSSRQSTTNTPIHSSAILGMDRDLQLLLTKAQNLLQSRNAAVVMGSVRLVYYLSPPSQHSSLVRPLLRILRSSPDIAHVVMLNILTLSRRKSELFANHATSFFLGASHEESVHVSYLKLDILVTICTTDNLPLVFAELATHIRSPEERIAIHAVSCLGKLAAKQELDTSSNCLAVLLNLLKKRKTGVVVTDVVIARAVSVVKDLIQDGEAIDIESSDKAAAIVYRLAALLFGTPPKAASLTGDRGKKKRNLAQKVLGKGAILHPVARASILWLLGQHARKVMTVTLSSTGLTKEQRTLAELVLPDVLRRCAINFSNEAPIVKLQILTLSSKLFAFLPSALAVPTNPVTEQSRAEKLVSAVTKIHFYVLKVARYDTDFGVRDRARFCKGLTSPLAEIESRAGIKADDQVEEGNLPLSSDAFFQQIINEAARSVGEAGSDPDVDLKGVRLRREQVIHVLFEGKPVSLQDSVPSDLTTGTSSEIDSTKDSDVPRKNDDDSNESPEIGTLSLVFGGKLIKGWLSTQLPYWTDKPSSSDLRDPPAIVSSHPNHSTSLSNTSISHLKSFSSADFVAPQSSNQPVVLTPTKGRKLAAPSVTSGSVTPVDLDPTTPSSKAQQDKYKDLDSFLDESEDEDEDTDDEESLGDSAPEDDDFVAHDDWEADDDDSADETEEEEEDDDEDEDGKSSED